MSEFYVPEWNMECKRIRPISLSFRILDQICYDIYMKDIYMKNSPLLKFQPRIYIYPYHTEPTAIISIEPIAIHTS